MNTIGPYHNRQETYKYFTLPFCKGPQQNIGHHHETMGEAIQGVELEFSGLEIGFKGMYKAVRGHVWNTLRLVLLVGSNFSKFSE